MEKRIEEFRGDYRFLSNFWVFENPVIYEGFEFYSVENAYVASKTTDQQLWLKIQAMKPGKAKAEGKRIFAEEISMNPLWSEAFKIRIMRDLVSQKFNKNPDLTEKLIATENAYIVEGNTWHDNFFGVCRCGNCPSDKINPIGPENHLGRLLMEIRDHLQRRL